MESNAVFSPCKKYRYMLWRIWDAARPAIVVIGVNPSTADGTTNDNTMDRVIAIADNNGYGGVYMVNCYPIVSSDPKVLPDYINNLNDDSMQQNSYHLERAYSVCKDVVCAWGNFDIVRKTGRDKELRAQFPISLAFAVNKNGSPKHPLYCSKNTLFVEYDTL